jgi:hypothetical protein
MTFFPSFALQIKHRALVHFAPARRTLLQNFLLLWDPLSFGVIFFGALIDVRRFLDDKRLSPSHDRRTTFIEGHNIITQN